MNSLWRLVLAVVILAILSGSGVYLASTSNSLFFNNKPDTTAAKNMAATALAATSNLPELHAVWVQARSVTSREKADEVLNQVEAGHFDAIFVNVFVYGQALYESALLQKYKLVEPDFDPLSYLISQARQRDLQVHAWLVAGPVGGLDGPILAQHPDWAMVSLDGERADWLNYNRPDVRQFISDLTLEIVEHYPVDGVHFDYTRYPHPGWKWGFDGYSAAAFAQAEGLDLTTLRYPDLPAYGSFTANPLAGVTTAQVLAEFDDGQPALLLNRYGTGEVILFNWIASERTIAADTVILQRSLDYLQRDTGELYLLRSETNAEKYSFGDFDIVLDWLEDLNQAPSIIAEADIVALDPNSILIMPAVYLIPDQTAADLANFVRQGGGLIFIDGPTPSIKNKQIQAITGMSAQGNHINRVGLISPVTQHDLIPDHTPALNLEDYQARDVRWRAFRQQGINKLLQDVYQRVKQVNRQTLVTITVAGDQTVLAEKHFLDWQAWLEGGYIDLIIPRAYVKQGEPLEPILAAWQPAMESSNRIMIGLSVYSAENSRENKNADQLLAEIALTQASNSKGVILFDLEGLNDKILTGLATGPFIQPTINH